MTVYELRDRLLCEFPEHSNEWAFDLAEKLTVLAEQMAFEMEVERDLAALPVVGKTVYLP